MAFRKAVEMATGSEDILALGRLLRGFGDICACLGDLDQAKELLEKSVSLLRQVNSGLRRDLAFSLYQLAYCNWAQGMYPKTKEYAQESLGLFAKSQDRYPMGLSTQMLGWVATYTGEYRKAVELLEESERLFQYDTPGARRSPGSFLGIIARLQGEYTQARQYLQNQLENLREAGISLDIGYALRELGYLDTSLGNYPLAKSQFEEGVEICKQWEARPLYLFLVTGLGNIARLQGEFEQAERLHQESLTLGREIGELRGVAICLENLGRLAYDKGEHAEAEARFLDSLKLYEEIGHPHGQATVLGQLAVTSLSLDSQRFGEAEQRLHRALSISTEIGATPLILEILRGYAELWAVHETSHTSQVETIELLSLILNHTASERETKDNVGRLWDKLSAELPAELMASAMNQIPSNDVETIAKKIMIKESA